MEVHYQPLLDTQTRRVQGYEALLRWKRRGGGYVSPVDFIPVAEETGLIDSLGEWVLREACREASTWCPEISLAVNLSPVQFRSGNIVQTVLRVLADTCMSPQRLELEVTESVLLEANEKTLLALHQLRKLGLRIALDDFGTGYSSLGYLKRLPVTELKIDRSFVMNLAGSEEDRILVRSTIELGHNLGLTVTAEGVEDSAAVDLLTAYGCDML